MWTFHLFFTMLMAVTAPTDTVVLRPNDALFEVLKPYAPPAQADRIARRLLAALRAQQRAPRPGDTLFLFRQGPTLERLAYRLRPWVQLVWDGTADSVYWQRAFLRKELVLQGGRIHTSFYEAAVLQGGVSPEVAVNFAEIFEWDMDFYTETEQGDSFVFLVERFVWRGRPARYGRILWARYEGKRVGTLEAYYFNGHYYNPDGEPMRRQFLKTPLRYRRISSYFGLRFHPILKRYRHHHGVDFAAPYGTPVSSIGDGVVVYAGWKGGYGKYIRIRHPNGYMSGYGHLSRIYVRRGQRVRQGQLIGRVGSTGLSTGPHLHFEILKDGRFVNPLRIKTPRVDPLPEALRPAFAYQKRAVQAYLQHLEAYAAREPTPTGT